VWHCGGTRGTGQPYISGSRRVIKRCRLVPTRLSLVYLESGPWRKETCDCVAGTRLTLLRTTPCPDLVQCSDPNLPMESLKSSKLHVIASGGAPSPSGQQPSCDAQEGCRQARCRRPRARVRQRGVRKDAGAAAAAVLQVQGRGLLLQGVSGGNPVSPGQARPVLLTYHARPVLLTYPHPLPFPRPTPLAARPRRGRPGTSTPAARRGRVRRGRSGAPRERSGWNF
jgi:hypothetical protein